MFKMKTFISTLLLLICSVGCYANPVNVTLVSVNGVSNGTDYVLPYELQIGSLLQAADCYDLFDNMSVGETWTANELTLSQAISSGQFSTKVNASTGYKQIAVLSTYTTATSLQQIELQEVMWDVFDPGAFAMDAQMTTYLNQANAQLSTFNYANTIFLEGTNNNSAKVQGFVLSSSTPEPGTMLLFGFGLIGLGMLRRKVQA